MLVTAYVNMLREKYRQCKFCFFKLVASLRTMDETRKGTTFSICEPSEQEETTLEELDEEDRSGYAAPQPEEMDTLGSIWHPYRDPTNRYQWFFCPSEPNLWCYASEVQTELDANGNIFFRFQGKWQQVIDPPASSDSAEQPAGPIAVDEKATELVPSDEQSAVSRAEQPPDSLLALHSVLECPENEGWPDGSLRNGSSVSALHRHNHKALEGWQTRLQSLDYSKYKLDELPDEDQLLRKLKEVAQFCPQLKRLVLPYPSSKTNDFSEVIQDIANACPKLTELYLNTYIVSSAAIRAVAWACNEMTQLYIAAINLTDAALYHIAQGCPLLMTLDVSRNPISTDGIKRIAQSCSQLRDLYVRNCTYLTDAGIESIALYCTRLKRLDVTGLHLLTDAAIQAVAQSCCSLERLYASRCHGLTDDALYCLARNCTWLEWLVIHDCHQITGAAWNAISEGCPRIMVSSWKAFDSM